MKPTMKLIALLPLLAPTTAFAQDMEEDFDDQFAASSAISDQDMDTMRGGGFTINGITYNFDYLAQIRVINQQYNLNVLQQLSLNSDNLAADIQEQVQQQVQDIQQQVQEQVQQQVQDIQQQVQEQIEQAAAEQSQQPPVDTQQAQVQQPPVSSMPPTQSVNPISSFQPGMIVIQNPYDNTTVQVNQVFNLTTEGLKARMNLGDLANRIRSSRNFR